MIRAIFIGHGRIYARKAEAEEKSGSKSTVLTWEIWIDGNERTDKVTKKGARATSLDRSHSSVFSLVFTMCCRIAKECSRSGH